MSLVSSPQMRASRVAGHLVNLGIQSRTYLRLATAHMNTKPRPIAIAGWLLLVTVLYVLSVGPAVRFGAAQSLPSGMRPGNFVGRVWQPILALDDTKARSVYRL